MRNILRMMLAVAAILTAGVASAQVETWQEAIDYTGKGESHSNSEEQFSLNMEGKSVLRYTIKDENSKLAGTSYSVWIQLRKKDNNGNGYTIVDQHHIGCVQEYSWFTKKVTYYKLSTTKTKVNNRDCYQYSSDDVINAETLDGVFNIPDATSDYYLYWNYLMTEYGNQTGTSSIVDFTKASNHGYSTIQMTSLKSQSVRYDIYDDKPLWTADDESTDVDATPVLSNRMNAVDHSGNAIDVWVHRKLTNGSWTTLCLPFATTVANLKTDDALGTDCIISEFSNVDLKKNRVNFLSIKDDTKSLKAGYPYLVYYNGPNKDSFKAAGVTFNYTQENKQKELTKLDKRMSEKKNDGYYYAALLQPTEAGAESESLGTGCMVYVASPSNGEQRLKKLKDGGSIKGFRAYLYYPSSGAQAAAKASHTVCVDDFIDGETTGVATVTVDGKTVGDAIYNLQGECVGADTSRLKAGIYVRGGKKFIVR